MSTMTETKNNLFSKFSYELRTERMPTATETKNNLQQELHDEQAPNHVNIGACEQCGKSCAGYTHSGVTYYFCSKHSHCEHVFTKGQNKGGRCGTFTADKYCKLHFKSDGLRANNMLAPQPTVFLSKNIKFGLNISDQKSSSYGSPALSSTPCVPTVRHRPSFLPASFIRPSFSSTAITVDVEMHID